MIQKYIISFLFLFSIIKIINSSLITVDPNGIYGINKHYTLVKFFVEWENNEIKWYSITLNDTSCYSYLFINKIQLSCSDDTLRISDGSYKLIIKNDNETFLNQTVNLTRKIPYIDNVTKDSINKTMHIYGNFSNVNHNNFTIHTCSNISQSNVTSITDKEIVVSYDNVEDAFRCDVAIDDSFSFDSKFLAPYDYHHNEQEGISIGAAIGIIAIIAGGSLIGLVLLIIIVVVIVRRVKNKRLSKNFMNMKDEQYS